MCELFSFVAQMKLISFLIPNLFFLFICFLAVSAASYCAHYVASLFLFCLVFVCTILYHLSRWIKLLKIAFRNVGPVQPNTVNSLTTPKLGPGYRWKMSQRMWSFPKWRTKGGGRDNCRRRETQILLSLFFDGLLYEPTKHKTVFQEQI